MRTLKYIIPLCALLAAGCSQKEMAIPSSGPIHLGIDRVGSRAAVDAWDNTTVGIAYAFGTPVLFNRALTVNVTDNNGEHINTGIEYPLDDRLASFVGYYPMKAPSTIGTVGYDITYADQDIMLSNVLDGQLSDQIPTNAKMVFEHKLTRFCFIMKCKPDAVYPETIHGIRAIPQTSKQLMSYVTLDLNSLKLIFSSPGEVKSSLPEGAVVPPSNASDTELAFDMMIQPGVPVKFEVLTLTGVKPVNISGSAIWDTLVANGGEAGKKYEVRLSFSGEGIMSGGITVTPWTEVGNAYTGGTWW